MKTFNRTLNSWYMLSINNRWGWATSLEEGRSVAEEIEIDIDALANMSPQDVLETITRGWGESEHMENLIARDEVTEEVTYYMTRRFHVMFLWLLGYHVEETNDPAVIARGLFVEPPADPKTRSSLYYPVHKVLFRDN